MSTFVRFIFVVLIAGAVLNLAVVMLSNAHTYRRQVHDLAAERERFGQFIKVINKQLRRGEITVEWQRVDANQKVVETSLLVRQFMPREDGSAVPLPVTRIIVPGDRVCIDGLKLYFDFLFTDEYAELRDTTLFEFAHIYADGTPADKRFNFLTQYEVPPATEVHATEDDPRPSYFENKLWQNVWYLILNPHPEKRGLTVEWMEPACKVLKGGTLYKITAGLEGITINDEDEGLNRSHREEMLREAEHLK